MVSGWMGSLGGLVPLLQRSARLLHRHRCSPGALQAFALSSSDHPPAAPTPAPLLPGAGGAAAPAALGRRCAPAAADLTAPVQHRQRSDGHHPGTGAMEGLARWDRQGLEISTTVDSCMHTSCFQSCIRGCRLHCGPLSLACPPSHAPPLPPIAPQNTAGTAAAGADCGAGGARAARGC